MTHVQKNNQLHNEVISPTVHGDRQGKGTTRSRRAWAIIALLAAGFFIHDAIWMTTHHSLQRKGGAVLPLFAQAKCPAPHLI